jgi:hypothetical protein
VADFPRIHRPIPHRGRLMRSTSPRIFERPGTAPLPSGPAWGRPRTIQRTPALLPADDETERAASPPPVSSGPDLDLLRLLQDKRKQRRGGDGTFIPGGDEVVEEYLVRLFSITPLGAWLIIVTRNLHHDLRLHPSNLPSLKDP